MLCMYRSSHTTCPHIQLKQLPPNYSCSKTKLSSWMHFLGCLHLVLGTSYTRMGAHCLARCNLGVIVTSSNCSTHQAPRLWPIFVSKQMNNNKLKQTSISTTWSMDLWIWHTYCCQSAAKCHIHAHTVIINLVRERCLETGMVYEMESQECQFGLCGHAN